MVEATMAQVFPADWGKASDLPFFELTVVGGLLDGVPGEEVSCECRAVRLGDLQNLLRQGLIGQRPCSAWIIRHALFCRSGVRTKDALVMVSEEKMLFDNMSKGFLALARPSLCSETTVTGLSRENNSCGSKKFNVGNVTIWVTWLPNLASFAAALAREEPNLKPLPPRLT